jgi:UDP-glucose 4-epimerase
MGHRVSGIGHGGWKADEWKSWGLNSWTECGISLAALEQYAQQPDVLIHCAGGGSVAFSMTHPLADFHRTVSTTMDVMEYIRTQSRGTRMIYPSSASVYGVAEKLPIHEDSKCAPISPYGVHKLFAENLIRYYAHHYQIRASIIRFFSVFGCGLKKQLLWDGCRKLAAGDYTFNGTGEEVRDWLHIDDATALLALASAHSSTDCPTVNGGTGQGVTVSEVLSHIASKLGVVPIKPMFSDNRRAGDPSAYIADISNASLWKWSPDTLWHERVSEYVEWWLLEMGMSPSVL